MNVWLGKERGGVKDLLFHIEARTTHQSYTQKNTGERYLKSRLKNMVVHTNDRGVNLLGSIPKYCFGNNISTLSRGDLQRAVESLSDALSLPIEQAKVNRVDYGSNLVMKYKPSLYLKHLGDLAYFKRLEQPSSIYYKTNMVVLNYYDKRIESKKEGVVLPPQLMNEHLLRYEMRLKNRLDKRFNIPEFKVLNLCEEDYYMKLIDEWFNYHQRIFKMKRNSFKSDLKLEPKQLLLHYALKGIEAEGGLQSAMQLVEELKEKGQFLHPKYAQRSKQLLKDAYTKNSLTVENELIQELDQKIRQAKANYR